MASFGHHDDSGRLFVPGPTDHPDLWHALLGYIRQSSSRPFRLVRVRLVKRMQAIPDMDRTDRFTELLKQYENDGREHIPDTEVTLVLMLVIREALPTQFRRPPWISDARPQPCSRDGSARTNEGRRDLEAIMSDAPQPRPDDDQPMSEADSLAFLADLQATRDPLAEVLALREMYKGRADLLEVAAWDLSSRLNVAVAAVLFHLRRIDDKGVNPIVLKFTGLREREIPRARVVATISEYLTNLGVSSASDGKHGPNT
jgi:hypothetical protein